jgi:predicted TIM-barrel fold metal-dependent hydrolase
MAASGEHVLMNRRSFLKGSFALLGTLPQPVTQRTIMIDSHVHVWKHSPEFPFAAGAKVPDFDLTAEDLLALMSANGVARTVLIQVIHYRWDNRYLLDVLHRYPGKFHGVSRVNP